MDGLISFFAKYLLIVPVLATVYIYLKLTGKAKKQFLVLLLGSGVLSIIAAEIARHIFYNPRPFLSDGVKPLFSASRDNGFPSDHTLAAAVIAFASLNYSKKFGGGLLVIAILIGWARVAAGVHHGLDVIGSLVIAALSYVLVKYLIRNELSEDDK